MRGPVCRLIRITVPAPASKTTGKGSHTLKFSSLSLSISFLVLSTVVSLNSSVVFFLNRFAIPKIIKKRNLKKTTSSSSILEIPHGVLGPLLLHPPNNSLKRILNLLKGNIVGPGIIDNPVLRFEFITQKLQSINDILIQSVLVVAEGHQADGAAL